MSGLERNSVKIFSLLLLAFYCHDTSESAPIESDTSHDDNIPRLLLISMDGFRWDYLDQMKTHNLDTPHFDMLIKQGCTIKDGGVKNMFSTITYPNHYSIVTGLTVEQHGVVANKMYDPRSHKDMVRDKDIWDNGFWYENGTDPSKSPEPIWITNQKAPPIGTFKRQSGGYFWPGCDTEINGMRPHKYVKLEEGMWETGMIERLERMVEWFAYNIINFGLLYFPEPDKQGHLHGPISHKVRKKIAELDTLLGRIMKGLKEEGLWEKINIILTSDHGMAPTSSKQSIDLNAIVNLEEVKVHGSVVLNIFPKPELLEEVYKNFSSHQHLRIYRKEEIPEDYHFRYNQRIGPLVAEADVGWHFTTDKKHDTLRGAHGYNNSLPEMHPIFIAHGPSFKKGLTVPQFKNTDIYFLMCEVLGIKPAIENRDSLDIVKSMLVEKPHVKKTTRMPTKKSTIMPTSKTPRIIITVVMITGILVVVGVYVVVKIRARRRRQRHDDFTKQFPPTEDIPLTSSVDKSEDTFESEDTEEEMDHIVFSREKS